MLGSFPTLEVLLFLFLLSLFHFTFESSVVCVYSLSNMTLAPVHEVNPCFSFTAVTVASESERSDSEDVVPLINNNSIS